MKRRTNWRTIAFVAGAALLVWLVTGFILAGRAPVPPPNNGPIVLQGCKTAGNRINTKSWSFECKQVTMSADGVNATIEGVKNGILYKKGKPYLKMAAQQVSVNTQTFDFTALGTVRIESISPKDGTRIFETDFVEWTNATKMLLLPHPSIVRSGDQVLKVSSLSVDFNKNDVHLGKIDGGFQVPGP